LWIAEKEGASNHWFALRMGVLNELRGWGEEDILKACMDGLTGFPEGVRTVVPLPAFLRGISAYTIPIGYLLMNT
jgi:transposase-like protein